MRKKVHWKRFYFEGNLYWGWIESPEDWEKVKKAYAGVNGEWLPKAKARRDVDDAFGSYNEYSGKKTLKEFFTENGMEF